MSEQWFYSLNNERRGPVDDGTLKGLIANGVLTPTSLVWKAGMANWVPAGTVDTLITANPMTPPQLPRQTPPPQPMPSSKSSPFPTQTTSLPPTSTLPAGGADPKFIYPSNPPQSKWLSLLNLLLPGVTNVVYGQVGKGIALIVASVLLAVTVIGYLALMVATTIDAYQIGVVLESGRPVSKWAFFPK